MFFSITNTKLENFPCSYQYGEFIINTDNGWRQVNTDDVSIIYKGYIDSVDIDQCITDVVNQNDPKYTGNFCAFVLSDGQIQIKTDRFRSFPIYVSDTNISNLASSNQVAWADSLVTIHSDFTITETKFNLIGNIDTSILSLDDVLNEITKILDQKIKSFLEHNTLPFRIFLTGGVDSMLIYSFVKKHTNNYELVKCLHFDYDYFWLKNSNEIEKFWGYKQIHHWNNPCVLSSGAPGDEFMLRSPVTSDLWLKSQNVKVIELLNSPEWSNSMQSEYFRRDKNYKIFQEQVIESDDLPWTLCNMLVNDWQHWHLGNTLTWTPLRDLEIFKLMLRLPIEDAISQVMDSRVSIKLIERNQPGLSKALSTFKNSHNMLSNLSNVYE